MNGQQIQFLIIVGGGLIISFLLWLWMVLIYFQTWVWNKQLTIKDCKCRFVKAELKRCKFHQECIGVPCALALNICDNPKHRKIKKFAPYYQLREYGWSKKEQLLAMKINEIIEALGLDK